MLIQGVWVLLQVFLGGAPGNIGDGLMVWVMVHGLGLELELELDARGELTLLLPLL